MDTEALKGDYLRWLMSQVCRVSLDGIDPKAVTQDADACLALDQIYTALLTLSPEKDAAELHKTEDSSDFDQGQAGKRLSAVAQMNAHKHLVLLGDPGSGKSTFVNFVALCLAGAQLEHKQINLEHLIAPLPNGDDEEPQPWEHGALLPLRVILRDFAMKGLPPAEHQADATHLWKFIEGELHEYDLGEFTPYLKEHFQERGGLLLLDGLDEVPEAHKRRKQIRDVVEDVVRHHRCRILVTSRTYAYQQQAWRLPQFAEVVLAPFNDAQIYGFVDRWYAHIAVRRRMEAENVRGLAELLKRAIRNSDRLRSLAERPLLLTLMASLHVWRNGRLPEKREALYAETVDLLLERWENRKVQVNAGGEKRKPPESLTEYLNVDREHIRKLLNRLAYTAHAGQPGLAGTADIAESDLVSGLLALSDSKDLRPNRLIEHLSDRAGLLLPRGVGVYTFPHRTFQEYLAACHLAHGEEYPDNIAALVRQEPNRWREVALLACARLARDGAAMPLWTFVEVLCDQEVDAEKATSSGEAFSALLAGQAIRELAPPENLSTLTLRNHKKLARVRGWLVAILTECAPSDAPLPMVERVLAGNVLAQLGDPRPGVGLCKDGLPDIDWCEVPEGSFLMGSDPMADKQASKDEQPQHKVWLSAYHIGRYPITNMQYHTFIEDGGYTGRWQHCWTEEGWSWRENEEITKPEQYSGMLNAMNHPVYGVSWYEAVAFCAWLTIRLRENSVLSAEQEIRLPTEAEWEKAARGKDGRIYPWGDQETSEHANTYETGLGTTSPVGCFPRGVSPYGCEEMSGNVWEWCQDWFDDFYSQSLKENPPGPKSGSDRVVRGGGWGSYARRFRSAVRNYYAPDNRYGLIGFRLVRTSS